MAVESSVIDHSYSELDYNEEGCMAWSDMMGRPHRIDGPAIVISKERFVTRNVDHVCWGRNGLSFGPVQLWYFHGLPHRIGGPAKIFGVDQDRVEWWVNGIQFSDEEKEEYEIACGAFCEQHNVEMPVPFYGNRPGHLTKRAIPN